MEKLNYIILHDGKAYRVFERLGKQVPFDAYNPQKHLGIGETVEDAINNSSVPVYLIEQKPYEVMFNE